LSKIAEGFMRMNMYEDSLEFCNKALEVDPNHNKSTMNKTISLTYLFEFEHAKMILT
jgi:lipoprotein NlpI